MTRSERPKEVKSCIVWPNNEKLAIFLASLSMLVAALLDQTIVLQSAAQETASPAPEPAPKPVNPKQLREDFRILRQALEEGHPGIYWYTSRAEMDKRFEQTEKSLDRPMNRLVSVEIQNPTPMQGNRR